MAYNIMDYFSGGEGAINTILSTLKYFLYVFPIFIILFLIIIYFRNKITYHYPVRIFKIRENGKFLENNYKGGYIARKNSAPFFRIKKGFWWWQYVDLIKTPNPAYLDEQDRVYYSQIDVDTYIQLKRTFDKTIVNFTPVEPDVKYGAILSIQRIKEVLRTESTLKRMLPYLSLIILAIIFLVAYWMLMDKCSV